MLVIEYMSLSSMDGATTYGFGVSRSLREKLSMLLYWTLPKKLVLL